MSTPKRGTYVIRLVLTPRSALCRSNFVSFWHGAWVFSLMGNSDSFQDKFVYVVEPKTPRNPTSSKHPSLARRAGGTTQLILPSSSVAKALHLFVFQVPVEHLFNLSCNYSEVRETDNPAALAIAPMLFGFVKSSVKVV